ncbi:MAG: esterase-like activity of phytase family protein, partial [Chitinophagaceae bacterium]
MLHRFLIFFLLISGVLSCTTSKKIASDKDGSITISSLNFLDEYVIPHNLNYNNTIVGGLSGIDYDAKQNRYFIISDERSYTSPARFYTARINLNGTRIDSVIFTSVNSLKQPGGDTFPSFKQNAQRTPDPESIRYNPLKNNLTWTSEGDREVRMGKMIYQSPYVYEMDLQGNFQDSFFIPHNLQITPGDKGPRENGVLEGSTFADNYKAYYVSMESPLYEDGPVAMFNYKGAPIRVTKF